MRESARILQSSKGAPFFGLGKKLDVDTIFGSLDESFNDYLEQASIEVIDCSGIKCGGILEDYFSQSAPFAAGEKRREFPDAISVAGLAAQFSGEEKVFVISEDKGIAEACKKHPNLYHLPTVEDFLSKELAHHEDVTWINDAVEEQEDALKAAISEAFSEGYFYLDDQEGEVEELEVTDVEIGETKLISANDSDATFEVDCSIDFNAGISYDDPNMTIYDEGEKFSFGTVNENIERTYVDTFTVTVQLDRLDRKLSDFHSSDSKSRSLSVTIYEDED